MIDQIRQLTARVRAARGVGRAEVRQARIDQAAEVEARLARPGNRNLTRAQLEAQVQDDSPDLAPVIRGRAREVRAGLGRDIEQVARQAKAAIEAARRPAVPPPFLTRREARRDDAVILRELRAARHQHEVDRLRATAQAWSPSEQIAQFGQAVAQLAALRTGWVTPLDESDSFDQRARDRHAIEVRVAVLGEVLDQPRALPESDPHAEPVKQAAAMLAARRHEDERQAAVARIREQIVTDEVREQERATKAAIEELQGEWRRVGPVLAGVELAGNPVPERAHEAPVRAPAIA